MLFSNGNPQTSRCLPLKYEIIPLLVKSASKCLICGFRFARARENKRAGYHSQTN